MTETIADRYRRLAGHFADTITAVDPHRWNDQSPCEEWSTLDVLRHEIDTQGLVLGLIGRELRPGPPPGSDPLGAWISASGQIQERLDDPVAALEEFDGPDGPMTFEALVDKLLSFDLVVHRWDLGRSMDPKIVIPPGDVAWAFDVARSLGEDVRFDGVCGPPLDPPDGASEQTRLLAYLGRASW